MQNIFQWKHNWTENQRYFHWVYCIFIANVVFFPSFSMMLRPILRRMGVCAQSRPTLSDHTDYSPPGCSVHGIPQARMLEWVAISSSRESSWSRDQTCNSCIFCIAGRFFIAEPPGSPILRYSCSVQFSSVAQSCPTLCDPMNRSKPGLPVYHQLPEFTQTQVHWVGDAFQPSHPLSSPSPPAFDLSQHHGLFQWVSTLHQVAKVLEFQLQHQSFQWTPRTDLL